jgi:hypothetical protein
VPRASDGSVTAATVRPGPDGPPRLRDRENGNRAPRALPRRSASCWVLRGRYAPTMDPTAAVWAGLGPSWTLHRAHEKHRSNKAPIKREPPLRRELRRPAYVARTSTTQKPGAGARAATRSRACSLRPLRRQPAAGLPRPRLR